MESTAEASLLFQPDILGMTSACQPQREEAAGGRANILFAALSPAVALLLLCRSPALSLFLPCLA